MFTGLVTDVGMVQRAGQGRFELGCGYALDQTVIGASIACDGCCLTVVEVLLGKDGFQSGFAVDVSNETLSKTTLGSWEAGQKINLERSLTPTTELGGHIVTGHVDGIASVVSRNPDGDSMRFEIEVGDTFAKFIAPKGCVALNGVSLTVNDVERTRFGVNLIPHTLQVTSWGDVSEGDRVNLEVDLLARYVARITQSGS
ncbi:MAG: riboflavin synthase [Hyphomicrobiaceae bacterium]|nr:riboflavin synthase [Hyphomicrobiaceae bacterium]